MRSRGAVLAGLCAAVLALAAAPAQAAKHCEAPGSRWARATPAEAGMDAARVRGAVNRAMSNGSFTFRIYRHGCLVADNAGSPSGGSQRYESWSLAKSVVSLAFGRAFTLGLISPDDPLGALITEADQPHGRVTLRNLLTMTSGLRWTALRDYNIFTPDRLGNALTVGFDHEPGTWYEYSQNGPALAAEAIARATGGDFQDFVQRELFSPIGIHPGTWLWARDTKGHTPGFFGLEMRTDDFARLGELMRRGGLWRGRRLLSKRYVREAVTPAKTNGCYGWLIWVNRSKPCVRPTITKRPVSPTRALPTLPPDLYRFSGLFGQIVATFPSQGVVIARNGLDSPISLSETDWERPVYEEVMRSIKDQKIPRPADADEKPPPLPEEDYGFQTSFTELDQVRDGEFPPPLPPAGPHRARAVLIGDEPMRASARGTTGLQLSCPARWPGRVALRCRGTASIGGGRSASYDIPPGATATVPLRLPRASFRRMARAGARAASLIGRATTADATPGGVPAALAVTVRPPRAAAKVAVRARMTGSRALVRVGCPRRAPTTTCRVGVSVRRAGRVVARATMRVRRGRARTVSLRLGRSAPGRLRINAESRARGRVPRTTSRTISVR